MPPAAIWRNWHETVTQQVRRFEVLRNPDDSQSSIAGYNQTTRRVQGLLREARDAGIRLRAVGGAWSFSPIAATDGILLATQHLNYSFQLTQGDVVREYPSGDLPVLLQAGISIADVNTFLADLDRALPTSGASNGQTIAGALGTGTHGSAIDVGAIPECVVAIHLATSPDGPTIWLERPGHRVFADETIENTFKSAKVEASTDDLFNAALVSFGCFGVVLGVVVEPVPAYFLHAFRQPAVLDTAMWTAIENMDFEAVTLPDLPGKRRRPRHFEVLSNPLDGDKTWITAMYKVKEFPPGAKPFGWGGFTKGDSALDVIGTITNGWDGFAPLGAKLFTQTYRPYENIAGRPGEIFRDTSTRGRSASSAMGVPLSHARQAFEQACDIVRRNKAPAFVDMRFVKATDATLGFTMHQPFTAIVEIDGAYSNGTLSAQREMWAWLMERTERNEFPHTFHWGKMNDLNAESVRKCYGAGRVQQWIDARRFLVPPEMRPVFSNATSDRLGLST